MSETVIGPVAYAVIMHIIQCNGNMIQNGKKTPTQDG